jgi:mono/diheme cytochrome c family protein
MRYVAALLLITATQALAQPDNRGMRSSLSGVYTTLQAERGHKIYLERCNRCHGLQFGSSGGGAPAFGGPTFNGDFEHYTLFDLENRIHTSMPRDQPGTTSKVEATDLTAFILSQMHAPAGGRELPADETVLRLIRIDVPD